MSDFIKEKSLSVGYNLGGQEFFNTLSKNWRWIHSYFFSFMYNMEGIPLKSDDVNISLMDSDTYGFPANLLLNTYDSKDCWKELILMALDVTNLTAVTVLTPDVAKLVKDTFPELEVHLSVRFWDWSTEKDCNTILDDNIDLIKKHVDVINISGYRSFNDHSLIKKIKSLGLKTKFIVNEGCIINHNINYNNFPGYENLNCSGAPCKRICDKLVRDYPWTILTRTNFYKEFVKYYDYDILKLSTRSLNNSEISSLISYWISDESTQSIYKHIRVDNKSVTFNEWVKAKSLCNGDCWKCRKCEEFYDEFMN